VRAALGHLLTVLEAGEVRLGAAKTRGLGRVRLAPDYTVRRQDLMTQEGMLNLLKGEASATLSARQLLADLPEDLKPRPRPRLDIVIDWEPDGPVMVKSDAEGISVDMLPLVGGVGGELALVIPGSSIKGALRTQAERIEATMTSMPPYGSLPEAEQEKADLREREPEPGTEPTGRDRFLKQLGRCPLAETLFGAPGKPGERSSKHVSPDDPPRPGLGALGVEDCFATPRFRRSAWQKVMSAGAGRGEEDKSQAEMLDALHKAGLKQAYPATHVAIDRWTGGAAENFLYSVLEPHGVTWPPMRLSVDLGRLPEGDRLPALALLLLTLRDLLKQRIPIGFAGNRGMGTVKVRDIAFELSGMDEQQAGHPGLAAFAGLTLNEETWSARQDGLMPLQDAWTAYLKESAA
jgi:CRISPR/Cas system CSM-associated protein Csm3 (group 7 of RAMP superfamily)